MKRWTKKINDMFVGLQYTDWINQLNLSGNWAILTNTTKVDWILKVEYRDKYLAEEFQEMDNADINVFVQKFLDSKASVLDKLYATTNFTYNPIENYNMIESGTDSGTSGATASSQDKGTSYNSSTPNLIDSNSSNSSAHSSSNHSLTRAGNIGVTTTQQMIEQERNIAEYDFLHYVAELIVNQFTQSLYDPNSEVLAYDSYLI
jgi:hypothetical protein